MLNKYIEFLKKLTDSVFNNSSINSISDYFEAVGRGFLLLFLVLFTIACVIVVIVGPFVLWRFVWKKLTAKKIAEINKLFEDGSADAKRKIDILMSKLKKIKVCYIITLVLLHIPVILPLIMIFIDFIF